MIHPRPTASQRRPLVRAVHLLLALPLGAVVYAPPDIALALRPALQFAVVPAIALSGLWLWQGARIARWRRGRGTDQEPQTNGIAAGAPGQGVSRRS